MNTPKKLARFSQARVRTGRSGPAVACERGFSLVEILVVVTIIAILSVGLGFSLSGSSTGASLRNAQRNVLAVIQATKANALLEGVPARFVVYSDTNQAQPSNESMVNGRKLRFYGVIFQARDPSTGLPIPNTWVTANEGSTLPEGIYFVPDVAEGGFAKGKPAGMKTFLHTQHEAPNAGMTTGIMQFQFGLAQAQANSGNGDDYYYMEFGPDGTFHDTVGGANFANVVVGTATKISDELIDFKGDDAENPNQLFSGVQVRYLGGIVPFNSRDDIH